MPIIEVVFFMALIIYSLEESFRELLVHLFAFPTGMVLNATKKNMQILLLPTRFAAWLRLGLLYKIRPTWCILWSRAHCIGLPLEAMSRLLTYALLYLYKWSCVPSTGHKTCKVFLILVLYCWSSLKCVLVTIKFLIDDSKICIIFVQQSGCIHALYKGRCEAWDGKLFQHFFTRQWQIFQKLVITILDVKLHVIPVIERDTSMALSDMVEPQARQVEYITSADSTFDWWCLSILWISVEVRVFWI